MRGYYAESLSGERLRRCYELAPDRVQQYLEAEIEFVLERIRGEHRVLELGCGYGRVMSRLAESAGVVVGIDTSRDSLRLAYQTLDDRGRCRLAEMNALALGFRDRVFDRVVCVQNGLAAFGVDPGTVVGEAIRVTRAGGKLLLSSYSDAFWDHRLEWFRIQAEHGLLGEIDFDATGDGVIACKDGFRAGRTAPADFTALLSDRTASAEIIEVDGSSLVCEVQVA